MAGHIYHGLSILPNQFSNRQLFRDGRDDPRNHTNWHELILFVRFSVISWIAFVEAEKHGR